MNFQSGRLIPASVSGIEPNWWERRDQQQSAFAARFQATAVLALIDLSCVAAGFYASSVIRARSDFAHEWLVTTTAVAPIYLLIAAYGRAYSATSLSSAKSAISTGVYALISAALIFVFLSFSFKATDQFSRIALGLGIAIIVPSLMTARYFFVRNTDWIIGKALFHTIVLRDGDHALPVGNYSLMNASDISFDPGTDDPMLYDQFAKSLESADRVIVLCDPDRRLAWAQALKSVNIQSEIVIAELDALAPLGVGAHGDSATLIVAKGPLGLFDRFVKRTFDVLTAATALIILSPLMVAIAVWIKIDSPGPVFFRQTRIGRANQMFEMWKFRSMANDASDLSANKLTLRDDDRVTSVGKFIRKTSLDELPQLFQVLTGDMSIVGPRPHALGAKAAEKLYWEVDERYWHRHAAKPGLTGLAQVRGYRGNTEIEADLINRLQSDLEYLDSWSLVKDLHIVIKTLRVMTHKNAF